jgi:hypothetical protein
MSAVFNLNHEKLAADPRFAATARELSPPEDKFMKFLSLIRLSTLALALAALGPRLAWAQDPSSADPIRAVVPADLKWAESKATPGAQVAVIEGHQTNRSRIFSGSSFPPTTRFRPIGIPPPSV